MPCVLCDNGEWQCGSNTNDLCSGSGGWNPAGALCLQFFVRKHPQTGNCLIKIKPYLLDECGGTEVSVSGMQVERPKKKKAKKGKKS